MVSLRGGRGAGAGISWDGLSWEASSSACGGPCRGLQFNSDSSFATQLEMKMVMMMMMNNPGMITNLPLLSLLFRLLFT